MKVYKITLWKFLKPSIKIIFSLMFFLSFMGVLMLGLFYRDGYIPPFLVVLTIICVLFFSIPNLALHINYYKEDRKKKLFIDFDKEIVTISKDGREKIFSIKDIVKIIKIGINPLKNSELTTAAWRYFYYYKIELKDNSTVCLTRFLIQNFENIIPKIPFEYYQQRYPIVKKTLRSSGT
jgi:hypothetical protein